MPVFMSTLPNFLEHNYQVVRELGRNREGGRISYLATNIDRQQQVVIKQFRFVQENASWQGFKTYEREINILQAVNHPRIPRYLDCFETQDGFCMVQEYKDAPSLATKNSLTPSEIKNILVSVLEILVDLQWRIPPIIHRDIKPENILVDEANQAYLIDFGLARVNNKEMAMSSVIAGTPGFMPPEELFHRPLTKASDLYSVGATAIALITHTPAPQLSNLIDENYQFKFSHLLEGINPDFIDWLNKMVAPNLNDRFSTAKDALDELQTIDIVGLARKKEEPKRNDKAIASIVVISTILAVFGTSFLLLDRQSVPVSNPKPVSPTLTPEQQWFKDIKSRCNAVEVVTAMRNTTYPTTAKGVGYAASCYALAGKLDLADRTIQELPANLRSQAAAVVFDIGHPVADAGDDKSAGPIMELVLRYWPNNYMALYHAGMSAYVLEEYPQAQTHLQEFLRIYQVENGWTNKAKLALTRMEQNIPADESFSIHH